MSGKLRTIAKHINAYDKLVELMNKRNMYWYKKKEKIIMMAFGNILTSLIKVRKDKLKRFTKTADKRGKNAMEFYFGGEYEC